ncbi:DUF998 domain-containing protein [Microbulbifer aggregans]|uniref:DUF998 domain-containing protein n=1 Tax=Microbulbifer aggregans TaxID=1769779 RepID=UPI001CFE411C|nr:DUF998 domain-containing protein [Microbulbifer aggregans]
MLAYVGAIASVWLVVGILLAARFYPNYNHSKQFCSELGAANSPTRKLSPIINNYPLGLMFCLFGLFVALSSQNEISKVVIGSMIVVHGLGTWVAGFFPMDSDPYTREPSSNCKVHSWAGVVMLFSLLIAPAAVALSSTFPLWLRMFSVLCIVGCLIFSITLAKAYKSRLNLGLHQRISYGFQILWLFVFSCFMAV